MTRLDVNTIDCEEIRLLRQSEKSTVRLVREKGTDRLLIQKILRGRHDVYTALRDCPHPGLPRLYEVEVSDEATAVLEEYVEGQPLDAGTLSEQQFRRAAGELCSVLECLHAHGIIHRDIKPSNILLAQDGHIRLIDFDAARIPKDRLEQDTRLLGTRGYAPPEQYGFAQTDERSDIYSLGVTLEQLSADRPYHPRYRRILQKCTNLNPERRYQSVRQVRRAFSHVGRRPLYGAAAAALLVLLLWCALPSLLRFVGMSPAVLPAPADPHWDGETGVALWGNVPASGEGDQVRYHWRLYRSDTEEVPDLESSLWVREGSMAGNRSSDPAFAVYDMNFSRFLEENGFYYFAVCAAGDGKRYTDSPYVLSDAFRYTGADAPLLPAPEGLAWEIISTELGPMCYATWSNLDDYGDQDSFNVQVFDENGEFVVNNIWNKQQITSIGCSGIQLSASCFSPGEGHAYRFAVEVGSSHPNEYRSVLLPTPIPEDAFSPWYRP